MKPLLLLLSVLALAAASAGAAKPKPVSIIFDSDIGPDVDDAGTTAVLNALADMGEAKILAMNCCTSNPGGAPCLDAINTWYVRPNLPIGTFKGSGFLTDSKYAGEIARRFPNDLDTGENAPGATEVYRKALARQPDRSVVVCAVGPLNNLARLLDSKPDRFSTLTGADLVKKKVKRLVVMGGRYPQGKEWNFEQDPKAAARVMADWPTPVLASGFEIGAEVKTGARLQKETPDGNPVRAAYALYVGWGKDRESWDQTGLLAAVRGDAGLWEISPSGSVIVDPKDGANRWVASPDRGRTYLIKKAPVSDVKRTIEDLMVRPPRKRQETP
jgi:hypothetical protein